MRRLGLAGLLLATALAHVAWLAAEPPPRPTGDELHYLSGAADDVGRGARWPIPGTLRFGHRPELMSRLLALVSPAERDDEALLRRVTWLQLLLLLGLVAIVHAQCRALGGSDAAALAAAASVALFPWLGFHVHALWPEVVHAFLFGAALLAALRHLHSGALLPLATSGVATGVALLAKGSLAPFVPLIAGLFAWNALRGGGGRLDASQARRALLVVAPTYLLAVLAVVGPQLAANAAAGHGARLAANRWWNLELGLSVPVGPRDPQVLDASGRWLPELEQTARYARAAPRAVGREAAARQRVMDFLAERPPGEVVLAQASKLGDLLVAAPSLLPPRQASFEQAAGHLQRWGSPTPVWLRVLREPSRWAWRGLLVAGLAGLLLGISKSPGRLLFGGFAIAFLVAGLAVPVKIRFLLPLAPVLAVGVGLLVDRVRAGWPVRVARS